jgi:hypothetical protein
MKVFISSTSEFNNEGRALEEYLNKSKYNAFYYLNKPAGNGNPRAECIRLVRESRIFVCLIGSDYGYIDKEKNISAVEIEFDTAISCPQPYLTVLMLKNFETGEIEDERQIQFRDRVSTWEKGKWCDVFDTTEKLIINVSSSISKWINDTYRNWLFNTYVIVRERVKEYARQLKQEEADNEKWEKSKIIGNGLITGLGLAALIVAMQIIYFPFEILIFSLFIICLPLTITLVISVVGVLLRTKDGKLRKSRQTGRG